MSKFDEQEVKGAGLREALAPEPERKFSLRAKRHLNAPAVVVSQSTEINEAVHGLREEWLRARVRGWMDRENALVDGKGRTHAIADWMIGSYVGKRWIFAATQGDRWSPGIIKEDLARRVCRYVNRESAHGGAWLVGWARDGTWFYMLWKDEDGDLQIEIAFDTARSNLALDRLLGWTMEDFCEHCEQAIASQKGWHKDMQYARTQLKRLAQGER